MRTVSRQQNSPILQYLFCICLVISMLYTSVDYFQGSLARQVAQLEDCRMMQQEGSYVLRDCQIIRSDADFLAAYRGIYPLKLSAVAATVRLPVFLSLLPAFLLLCMNWRCRFLIYSRRYGISCTVQHHRLILKYIQGCYGF